MIFCNLGSGSKGNSTFIQDTGPALLIDQGFSVRKLVDRMETAGLNPRQVGAVILTHEHSDHLQGVGIFARRYRVPVYITAKTFTAIPEKILKNVNVIQYTAGDELAIADLKVKTFHIPHDATDPVAMVISGAKHRVGVITDIGTEVQYLREYLYNLDLLFLESNHDVVMLDNGPYPLWLRMRIKSRVGHLSNEQAAVIFEQLALDGRLKYLILGHLSEQNNTPDIVREQFVNLLRQKTPTVQISIAKQHEPGPVFLL